MSLLLASLDRICRAGAALAALALAGLFLLGMSEIVARNLLGAGIGVSVEYSGYGVALVLLLGAGEAVRTHTHVRVSLLRDAVGARAGQAVDIAATLLGLAVALFWMVAMIDYAATTGRAGVLSYFPSQTPLVVPQALLALGPVTLVAGLLARLIRLSQAAGMPPKDTEQAPPR